MTPNFEWQKECLTEWNRKGNRGIVQAVTGSGKTRLAISAIQCLKQQNPNESLYVKIVVPSSPLLYQWKRALEEIFPETMEQRQIGLISGSCPQTSSRPYMIYIINSARYRLAKEILSHLKKGETVLLIADECHHYTSKENRKIFDFLPFVPKNLGIYCSLGLSATLKPCELDFLTPMLGETIYSYGFSQAIRKGTICDFSVRQIALEFTKEERNTYDSLSYTINRHYRKLLQLNPELYHLTQGQLFHELQVLASNKKNQSGILASKYLQTVNLRRRHLMMASARIKCTIDLLRNISPISRIIIFGESIEQINHLYHLVKKEYPGQSGCYHSKMGKQANKNTLNRFRTKELRILLACRSLDEGFDIPDIDTGIILSGTSVERQRLQRLGRILRLSEKKQLATLYYLFIQETKEEPSYVSSITDEFSIEDILYYAKSSIFTYL